MKRIEAEHPPLSKLHRVGTIVNDIDQTAEYYKTFGVCLFEDFHIKRKRSLVYNKQIDYPGVRIKQAVVSPIRIELLQPVNGDQYPWMQFLQTRGEGVHHMGFVMDDLEREEARLNSIGVEEIYKCEYLDGGGAIYFATDEIGGAVVEVFQWPNNYTILRMKKRYPAEIVL
ncbi:VOC family protein [Chloroflexota bacterium]